MEDARFLSALLAAITKVHWGSEPVLRTSSQGSTHLPHKFSRQAKYWLITSYEDVLAALRETCFPYDFIQIVDPARVSGSHCARRDVVR